MPGPRHWHSGCNCSAICRKGRRRMPSLGSTTARWWMRSSIFKPGMDWRPDGKLGKDTIRQLNTPMSVRVQQLEDALESWRWLPADFPPLPVAVNIPEFVLRVFSADHRIAMRMHVIVGKAVRHQTPVFAQDMKYIVFRPYWNVPFSITRGEIIPRSAERPRLPGAKEF